ncbi:hypothetical protein P692DRAFT_20161632 [Suillus brevipes Sb2]|nr:hypothetical protein P692DRAFT_20161632 [Suillus brevipes Sb2]
MLGDEQRVRRMGASNQKSSGTPVKLLMKHHSYLHFQSAALCACDRELSIELVFLQDMLESILLLVSMAVRAKHRMRYEHTYFIRSASRLIAENRSLRQCKYSPSASPPLLASLPPFPSDAGHVLSAPFQPPVHEQPSTARRMCEA